MNKEQIIKLIENRILTEQKKYSWIDKEGWAEIAACKIYSNLVEIDVIQKENDTTKKENL